MHEVVAVIEFRTLPIYEEDVDANHVVEEFQQFNELERKLNLKK